jgi:hypothetical protein
MWSEEYQAALIEMSVRVFRRTPEVIGEHVWNFADFSTAQAVRLAGDELPVPAGSGRQDAGLGGEVHEDQVERLRPPIWAWSKEARTPWTSGEPPEPGRCRVPATRTGPLPRPGHGRDAPGPGRCNKTDTEAAAR